MKLSLIFTILCSIALIACNGETRQPVLSNTIEKEPIDSFIKRRADSLYKAQSFPGMFVAVLDSNRRFYYTVGYADPDTKTVFDSLTQFEAGSITKTFTAFVLTRLLQEKKISDTSQISPWLPDSVRRNKQIASISFLQLLNHTSGLPRLPYNMDLKLNEMAPYDNYKEADLYAYLVKASPKTTGESKYSNLGMGLAGILAQKISGKSYEQLLTKYIYKPFALNADGIPGSGSSSKSQGYFGNRKAVYWNMSCLAPCGNLKCNATELLNYLSHMSVPDSSSEAVLENLLVPTATVEGAMKIGRGWFIIERDSLPQYYWHNGGTYGFSTFAGFLRGSNKAVVIVINEFNRNETSDAMGFAVLRRLAL